MEPPEATPDNAPTLYHKTAPVGAKGANLGLEPDNHLPNQGKKRLHRDNGHERLPIGDVARGDLRYKEPTNALVLRGRNGDYKARIELLDRFSPFLHNLLRAIEGEYKPGKDTTLEGDWTIERDISIFEVCEQFGCRKNAYYFAEEQLEKVAFDLECSGRWKPEKRRDFRAFLGGREKPYYGWLWIHRQVLREMGKDPMFEYDSHKSRLISYPRYACSFQPDEDLERLAHARRVRVIGPWQALPRDGARKAASKLRAWLISEHSRDWICEAFSDTDLEILGAFCEGHYDAWTLQSLQNAYGVTYPHVNRLTRRREDILIRLARLRREETASLVDRQVTGVDFEATRLYYAVQYGISMRQQHKPDDEIDPDQYLGYERDIEPGDELLDEEYPERWTDVLDMDDQLAKATLEENDLE